MQPYEKAAEALKKQGEMPIKALRNAASFGLSTASAVAGGQIMSRALPFLSKYVPEELAIKGLSKIDPRFGKFINSAMSNGKSFDDVRDFIGKKSKEDEQEQAKDDRNILQRYSNNLHLYITDLIKNGSKPGEAGMKAKKLLDKKDQEIINRIEKDYKSDFPSIVESIYGRGDQAQPQQTQQEQSQQSGQGQQALMQMLQQINQRFGA